MSQEPPVCPKCGERLTLQGPLGLCLKCLVELGTSATEPGQIVGAAEPNLPAADRRRSNLPRRFGEYELTEEIARGGMGVIYRARQVRLNREVAVKMVLYGQFAGEDYFKRFLAEAQSIAKLRHPNIIAVFDVGVVDGLPFFSMEYIPGQNLAELAREQPLAPLRAAQYLERVARAVHHAHQQQVLHRDLKPSNILVDTDDQPHVTDFGLARQLDRDSDLTISGQPLGTPNYMPPEQVAVRRADLGPASDIYSLGAILYHLLTGRPPFLGVSLANTFAQILNHEPVAPRLWIGSIPRDLETVCLKCLAKDPGKRYATAEALAEELGRVLRNEPIRARPAGAVEKAWRWCQRRPALASWVAVLCAILVSSLLLITREWREAKASNSRVVSTMRDAEMRLAEVQLIRGPSLEGLATLARLARQFPGDPVTVNRLFSELNYNNFVRPIGAPIHDGQIVWSADLSADEQFLVTTTDSQDAFVWQHVGQPGVDADLRFRLPHPQRVFFARFSPDGKRIATACADGQIRIWDLGSGKLDGKPFGHTEEIVRFAFCPNGAELASLTVDGTVWMWSLVDRTLLWSFHPPSNVPNPLADFAELIRIHDWAHFAFSPDGRWLFASSDQESACLLDIRTGLSVQKFPHGGNQTLAEFSPDGGLILTSSRDPSVAVWDPTNAALRAREQRLPTLPIQAHFSPDGKKAATGFFNHTVSIWDAYSGQALVEPLRHKSYIQDLCFSPDGQILLVAVHDGTAHLWDVSHGRELCEPVRAAVSLRAARFLRDGRRFMTRGTGGVRFWEFRSAARATRLSPADGRQIYAVRFDAQGHNIVAVDADSAGRCWDARSPKRVVGPVTEPGQFFQSVTDASIPYEKRSVAAALLWERQTGLRLNEVASTNQYLASFAATPDGSRVVLGFISGGGKVLDFSSSPAKARPVRSASVFVAIEFSQDGRRIATASLDGTAQLWDGQSGEPISPPLRHSASVTDVRMSPSGQCLACAGDFQGAHLWRVTGTNVVDVVLPHGGEVFDVEFDATGNRLVTASADWTAVIWDTRTGEPMGFPMHHELDVRQARFTPDGSRVVTACADGSVRIWDVVTGLALGVPLRTGEALSSLDIAPDGSALVCASLEGGIFLCDMVQAPVPALDWLPDLAEALAGTHQVSASLAHPLPPNALSILEARLRKLPDKDFYSRWVKARFLTPEQSKH